MAVCMISGLASCSSSDDDNNNGRDSNNGTLVLNGESIGFGYCYYYNSQDGELIFTNHNWLSIDRSFTNCMDFQIYFAEPVTSFENITLNPDEYEIWFDRGGKFVGDGIDYSATYAWEPRNIFLNVKSPGKLTINRVGNTINVKIENLCMYGGDGFNDVYSGSSLPSGYSWMNGSFEFSGTMTDISSLMKD